MVNHFFTFEQMAEVYTIEQDWLFRNLLSQLNAHAHLLLTAELRGNKARRSQP